MNVAILKSGENTKGMSKIVQDLVCKAIESSGNAYKIISVDSIGFKRCEQKECLECELDNISRYRCKKYTTCIENHNRSIIESVGKDMISCEAYIVLFLINEYQSKFKYLVDGLKAGNFVADLQDKKYLLVLSSEEKLYSDRGNMFADRIREILSKSLKMKALDTMVFSADNGNYMKSIIPIAISTFILKYKQIQQQFIGHKTSVKFQDMQYMQDMYPEILSCLNQANVATVGELAEKSGEEIFEILEHEYNRVVGLVNVYYKNDIPFYLLDDVVKVAEDYKNSILEEWRLKLEEVSENLERIEKEINYLNRTLDK